MAAKVSLKQIAEKSGVSVATVSQILNSRSGNYSSEETKSRVRTIARELGYQVNFGYRLMLGQKTKTVAILNSMPEMNFEEYILKLIILLISGFDKLGYSTYCNTFSSNPEKNLNKIRTLVNRGVEHFVFLGCPFGHEEMQRELATYKLPMVSSSPTMNRHVGKDSMAGAEAIFRNLIERLNGDNFKLICQHREARQENDRIQALMNIFPDLSLEQIIDRYLFCHANIDFDIDDYTRIAYETAGTATGRLLESFPDTGAICYMNDTLAVGGGRFLLGNGRERFRHILLAGFNNNESVIRNFPLPITSVSFDLNEIAELLIQNALHDGPCRLMLYPKIHIRTPREKPGDFPDWVENTIDLKPRIDFKPKGE